MIYNQEYLYIKWTLQQRKQRHIMAYYTLNTILNDDIQAIITDIISDVISHYTSLVSLSDEYKE